MFKKFFNWIKSIINYIDEKKKEEFRYKLDVYYTPKDFYTNPEYQKYKNMKWHDNTESNVFVKFNTILFFNKYINALFTSAVTVVLYFIATRILKCIVV